MRGCQTRLCTHPGTAPGSASHRTPFPRGEAPLPDEGQSAPPNCGNANSPGFVTPSGDVFDDGAARCFITSPSFTPAQSHKQIPAGSVAQLCWIPECCSQANPSHRSCNSWSLQLPSLPTSPTQHILPAARSALGPVQDPAAPAYHTPPERSHLSAGTSPAALHGVTLALCLETWPLSQADNSQHRIKTWCLTWSRAPSAQPHSPRQQEKAPQSKGGLSETRGTAQIWVWAPFWQAGGCDEVWAARNANTSTANTPRDKEYNRA